IPAWAATTFWFLRSYQTRSPIYAALAGVGAAACMLGKYWSVFLLAGLAVAALIDKRRAGYFRSAAPWITVLAPHLVWLAQNDFAPFSYAVTLHGDKPFAVTVFAALGYLAGSISYVAIPVIIVLAAARPNRATIADMVWPGDSERRLAAAAFWAPLLLPAAGALASGTEITSLWSMSAWTLLPVLLLSSPKVTMATADTRGILVAAVAVPLIVLIAAPAIAINVQHTGPQPAAAHARLLALQIERAWHEVTPQPMRYVGGDPDIAYGVAVYAGDRPRALPGLPQPNDAELAQSGMVLVCFVEDVNCRQAADALAARIGPSRRIESEIVHNYLSFLGKPQRYTILIVPPRP